MTERERLVEDVVKAAEYRTVTDARITDLASRVAELERQLAHESRCRIELDGGVESMHLRLTESIAALRRDVDAMRGTGPCACKSTTPAPTDALPFGCVAREKQDGRWQIEDADGSHRWASVSRSWCLVMRDSGIYGDRRAAIADFHATNKGVAPPGEASIESRVTHFDSEPTTPTGSEYEVETCPHNVNKNRVVHDGLFMLIQNGHIRWTSDAWTPLDRVDAETIAAVLRNAQ